MLAAIIICLSQAYSGCHKDDTLNCFVQLHCVTLGLFVQMFCLEIHEIEFGASEVSIEFKR